MKTLKELFNFNNKSPAPDKRVKHRRYNDKLVSDIAEQFESDMVEHARLTASWSPEAREDHFDYLIEKLRVTIDQVDYDKIKRRLAYADRRKPRNGYFYNVKTRVLSIWEERQKNKTIAKIKKSGKQATQANMTTAEIEKLTILRLNDEEEKARKARWFRDYSPLGRASAERYDYEFKKSKRS